MVIIWGIFGIFFELALLEDWVTNFPVRVVISFYWYNHMVNREYLLNKVGTYTPLRVVDLHRQRL